VVLLLRRASINYEGKGKVRTISDHDGPEGESRYSSILLDGGGVDSQHHPPPLRHFYPREKESVLILQRLCGPQGQSGQVRIISPPPAFDSRTAQSVASLYTGYAASVHQSNAGISIVSPGGNKKITSSNTTENLHEQRYN